MERRYRRFSRWGRVFFSAPMVMTLVVLFVTVAGAESVSAAPVPGRSHIVRVVNEDKGIKAAYVYSAAMRKVIKVQVVVPKISSVSRPTLYLLGGLGEETPNNSVWVTHTDLTDFFADKNVTVVLPIAGNGSMYTDWQRDDPVLGRYRWESFLTRELPPLIEQRFDGNGKRGIAGLSMGAGASLVLAARNPGFYNVVASYSGCYSTTGVAGQSYPRAIVTAFHGDANNMWGPPSDPDWARHDIVGLAANLRGTKLYVSSGTGRAGRYDEPGYPGNSNPLDRQVIGGGIEVGTYWCTRSLQGRLRQLRIPATIRFVDPGTHSWPYWVDQQRASWPTIRQALGI